MILAFGYGRMSANLLILGLIYSVVSSAVASALDVRISGDSLVVFDGRTRFSIPDVVDYRPIATCVHAYQKHGDEFYVVLGVREWSRGYPPRSGLGGAGVESKVAWLHIRDQKIVNRDEGVYESFWDVRSGVHPKWRDGKLHWGVAYLRPRIRGSVADFAERIYWTYNPAEPERGIQEKKERIPIQ